MRELSAEPKMAGSRVPEAELSTEPFDVPAAEAPAMTTSDGERDAAGQGKRREDGQAKGGEVTTGRCQRLMSRRELLKAGCSMLRCADRSVAVDLVAEFPAEAWVRADILKFEPKGPRGQRAVIKEPVAPLEQLPPEGSGAGRLWHPLRADRQLAPAEVALDLRPEPPAGCRGLRRQTEQAEGHQSEQESLHFDPSAHHCSHAKSVHLPTGGVGDVPA